MPDLSSASKKAAPRILVVEDEQIVALDLQERLKELGYLVPAVAASGDQAVEMVKQERPDLILMDIHLRGTMDGIDAADRIRDQFDLPVVYLTAFSDASTLQRARLTGPFGYLVKPFDIDNVHSTIEMALHRHQLDQTLKENARFLTALNDITRTALETTGLAEVARVTVESLRALYQADACHVCLWEANSHSATAVATSCDPHKCPTTIDPGALDRFCRQALESRRPLEVQELAGATELGLHAAALDPIRSILALPLITGDRRLGAVLILCDEPRTFSQQDLARGRHAALHVSLAIARAQMLEDLEATVHARTHEIASEKEKSETILRNVDHAIMMTDGDLVIRYINPAFTALTGYSEEDALGRPAGSIGAAAGAEAIAAAVQSALDRGEGWQGEVTGRRKDGRVYDAALSLSPVLADGILVGVVSSHQDISLRRNLERARNRFLANVSHELRTPITSILLYSHLLRTLPDLPEKSSRHLQVLDQQVMRLKMLVEDILEITDLDSGHAIETWDPIPVALVVREVMDGYRQQVQQANLTLALCPLPPDLPSVAGDPIRLGQALAELMENAVTFTPSGGQIKVEIATTQYQGVPWITIAIRDSGPGIPADEVGSIFERFFRGSLTEAGDFPGTGLGLSIVHEIVRAHGGRITVESAMGVGSTFTLWLPANPDRHFRRNA